MLFFCVYVYIAFRRIYSIILGKVLFLVLSLTKLFRVKLNPTKPVSKVEIILTYVLYFDTVSSQCETWVFCISCVDLAECACCLL